MIRRHNAVVSDHRISRIGFFLACLIAAGCAAASAAAEEQAEAAADHPRVVVDRNGLTLRTVDDTVSFNLGGRLHVDFGSGDSSAVVDPVPDNARIRRFRIEPKLTVNQETIFGLQYNPTNKSSPIDNLFLSYKGFEALTLTAGNFKEPFSFERMMSSNHTMFMERSLADAFAASRNTGFAIGAHGDDWTLSGGVFGGNINSGVSNEGIAGSLRATYAPILTADEVLHLGAAASYRAFDGDGLDISFDTRPESFLFKTPLVDTGAITGTRAVARLGLELAWAHGPFRAQAEYIAAHVERAAASDVVFRGGYLQAAWVINGRSPPYALEADTATEIGVFKQVQLEPGQRVTHGGVGVFELAGRYSAIDLDSRDIRGGFEQDVTVGLNWYLEPFIRVMANYIHVWADPTAQTLTGRPAQADIGQVRLQIAF